MNPIAGAAGLPGELSASATRSSGSNFLSRRLYSGRVLPDFGGRIERTGKEGRDMRTQDAQSLLLSPFRGRLSLPGHPVHFSDGAATAGATPLSPGSPRRFTAAHLLRPRARQAAHIWHVPDKGLPPPSGRAPAGNMKAQNETSTSRCLDQYAICCARRHPKPYMAHRPRCGGHPITLVTSRAWRDRAAGLDRPARGNSVRTGTGPAGPYPPASADTSSKRAICSSRSSRLAPSAGPGAGS